MDFIKFQETPQQQTNAALDGDLSHSQFYNASEQTQNQPYYPTNPKPDPSPSETHLQYSTGIQPPVVDPCIDPCMPVPYVPGAGYEGLGGAAACFHDAGAEQRSSVVDSDGYGAVSDFFFFLDLNCGLGFVFDEMKEGWDVTNCQFVQNLFTCITDTISGVVETVWSTHSLPNRGRYTSEGLKVVQNLK